MKVDVDLPRESIPKTDGKKEMLGIEDHNGQKIVRVNPSSIAILQTCWRKGYYNLIRQLVPDVESPALCFGKGIHKALETFYSSHPTQRQLPKDYEEKIEMIGYGAELDCMDRDWET